MGRRYSGPRYSGYSGSRYKGYSGPRYRRKTSSDGVGGLFFLLALVIIATILKYWYYIVLTIIVFVSIVLGWRLYSYYRSKNHSTTIKRNTERIDAMISSYNEDMGNGSASYNENSTGTLYHSSCGECSHDSSSSIPEYVDEVQKGDAFEKYVVDLFPENEFTIVEWTTDIMRKHNRYVEADTRPDILFRHNKSGIEFYVECKYRSYSFQNKISWSNSDQLKRYQDFAHKKGLPLFIVIGVGGEADCPLELYCLPIEKAKWPELFQSYIDTFQRSTTKDFILIGNSIM